MLVWLVVFGALLFSLGLIGFVTRKNLIIIFLCTELMFQGIVVNAVAFSCYPLSGLPTLDGQVLGLFLLAIAAAEAALGLAIVVLLFRHRGTLDANAYAMLREE